MRFYSSTTRCDLFIVGACHVQCLVGCVVGIIGTCHVQCLVGCVYGSNYRGMSCAVSCCCMYVSN